MATDIPGFPQNKLDYKVTLYNGAALLPHITTPSQQLQNGMLWTTTAGLFVRINGTTVGPLSGAGTITGWTPSLNTAAPNATDNVSAFRASGGSTNQLAAVVPKGTGGLIAAVPDSTAVGGNTRGIYSVDLQLSRNAATDVAAVDYAVISGGAGNRVNGSAGVVAGGNGNAADGSGSVVSGGTSNVNAGDGSTICGGTNHTIVAGAFQSVVTNGAQCNLSGRLSRAGGTAATDRGVWGADAYASASIAGAGDVQRSSYTLAIVTTDATVTTATTTAQVTPTSTNQITLLPGSAYRLKGHAIARQATTGDCKSWDLGVTIKQGAAAANTAIVGTSVVTAVDNDTNAATWTITLTADTTTGCLSVKVTGQAAKTIKWSIRLDSIEVVG